MLRESQRTTAFDSYINRLENKNEDELKEEYESRFGNYMKEARDERIRSSQSSHYMGSGRLDKINQRSLLPTDTKNPLLIKSALCLSSLKGYVYVEATRESHVQEAIQGMTFINHFKLALVPIEEMVTVVTVKQKIDSYQKRGIGSESNEVFIKEIWHRSFKSKENTVTSDEFGGNQQSNEDNNNNSGGRKRKKRQGRPQQKAFDANEILSLNGIVESKLDGYDEYHIWNDDDLENLSGDEDSLSDDSMDEDDDNYDKEDEGNLRGIRRLSGGSGKNKEETDPIKMLGPLLGNRKKTFEKGDKIRVIDGDLRNLLGTVEYVEDENVFIKPDHKLLTDLLPVPISQLSKHFDLGTQIKVIDGARKGETGIILAIDGEYAIFFSDSSDEEVKVFINDIQITKQISSGTDTLGQYSMFDLVDLDAQTVGVITKVETDSFKVMDNLGNVRSIKLAEMGQKRNRRGGICVDMANQPIHTNDTVKIVEQRYRGRQARVKHIYRSFVFLHARDILENNGIIVTRSKNVQLVGGLKTREIELLQKQPLPLTMRSRFGKGTRRRKGRNRDEWIGKSVIIQKGPKKGYAGIVIDANELKLRIELHTNAKVINVPRSNVIEPETKTSYGSGYSYTDSNTAYTDSKTPIWDVKTPIHDGSSTPFYDGSMTPMRGFDTPMTGPTPISTPLNSSTGNTLSGMSMNMSGTGQTSTNSGIKSTPRSEDIWNTTQNSSIQIPESPWQTTTTNVSQNLSFTPVNDYPQTPQTSTPNQTFGGTNLSSNQSQVFEPSTPSVNTPKSGTTPFYENHPTTTTPYTQGFTPSTPMTPFVQNTNQSWLTPGIEVKVNTNEGQAQIGIIRSVLSDGNCQIFLTDRNEMVSVQGNNLQPQVPQKNDKIRVIDGLMKGKVGNLMQIDQSQGIVQIDSEFKIIELSYLAKLVD
ncbi:transcription elongation factor spt5 [Anaeramoeba flamelloides]|uniref:DRB sensitivity-inducing factor large subunit n=1 Tax=Anaeramoeba flamelloides TaxID=1746091 RepID=A0AAV7ZTG0_9EUKA|nr:transcription elongation factor spt5 [Anaeramoeba flamelloides]